MTSNAQRTARFLRSSQFVTHEGKIHTHQTASISIKVSTAPRQREVRDQRVQSCVMAKTKKRLKTELHKADLVMSMCAAGTEQRA